MKTNQHNLLYIRISYILLLEKYNKRNARVGIHNHIPEIKMLSINIIMRAEL